jgi:NAD(P)-dependent dehydrogenase (short-subunit alcohol dehydrogenase family)
VDKFLAEGATVIAADIAPSAESEGALSVQLDQASEESVASLEQWLSQRCGRTVQSFAAKLPLSRFGRLDCLVNNAALGGHQHPLHLKPLSEFDSIMAVNVRGPWLLSQMAIRLMLPAKKGIVINISSIVGQRGAPNSSAYAISKSAINGLTRCLAAEYAGHGIRCVVSLPWWFLSADRVHRASALAIWMSPMSRASLQKRAKLWSTPSRKSVPARLQRSPTASASWPATNVRT